MGQNASLKDVEGGEKKSGEMMEKTDLESRWQQSRRKLSRMQQPHMQHICSTNLLSFDLAFTTKSNELSLI